MNLAEQNIENLTSMWRVVNENMKSHYRESHYEYGVLNYSKWPNRLWFKGKMTKCELEKAIEVIKNNSSEIIVPHWDLNNNQYYKDLEKYGFEKKLEQTGMSLKLGCSYNSLSELKLEKVNSITKSKQWEKLFERAFNYNIAESVIINNQNDLDFIIAKQKGEPIGTVLLYSHNENVIGIHSMGVIPEKRRQGFAEEIMVIILNKSIKKGYKYATLQASELGKGLYLKLGFKEQFKMRSYILKQNN